MTDGDGFQIESADDGAVRWLTLSSPARRNAITGEGFEILADAFESFEASAQRVLVISGAGDHFCSGADLAMFPGSGSTAAETARAMTGPSRTAAALHEITKPTVAAVDGVAFGAGMSLALGCDIVYASDRARFGEIFVRRGLVPDVGGTWLLPRLVGIGRARELALTGREIDAEEALGYGLIARVVPAGELAAEAGKVAAELAEGAPLAQMFTKSLLSRSSSTTFEQALALEAQAQAVLLTTDDVAEAVEAFIEKRPPRFEGR